MKAALLVEAEPAQALLSSSKAHLGSLIVIGAIRDRAIAGRLLGDVASAVVRRAHCDVLVIRPANTDEGDQVRPESSS